MKETAASTAYGPMLLVAFEQLFPPEQRIIDDELAYQILPGYMKFMVRACRFTPLRNLMLNLLERSTPGLVYIFAGRKRYIDETITKALNDDIQSVVILGAGLDTLAYRVSKLSAMRVYEVDLPENIRYKKQALEKVFGSVPEHVTLVPVDFQTQSLDEVLLQVGYTFDQKTFFLWEAVTQYLTETAVNGTFQCLSQAQAGSRLIFTYVVQDFLSGQNKHGLDSLYVRMVEKQVWHFGLDPDSVREFVGRFGWTLLEDVSGGELSDRYMKPVGRMDTVTDLEHIAYAEKKR